MGTSARGTDDVRRDVVGGDALGVGTAAVTMHADLTQRRPATSPLAWISTPDLAVVVHVRYRELFPRQRRVCAAGVRRILAGRISSSTCLVASAKTGTSPRAGPARLFATAFTAIDELLVLGGGRSGADLDGRRGGRWGSRRADSPRPDVGLGVHLALWRGRMSSAFSKLPPARQALHSIIETPVWFRSFITSTSVDLLTIRATAIMFVVDHRTRILLPLPAAGPTGTASRQSSSNAENAAGRVGVGCLLRCAGDRGRARRGGELPVARRGARVVGAELRAARRARRPPAMN